MMLFAGIAFMAIGMGIYISARFGTGPRDSLMMAIHFRTGWKVQNIRFVMEVSVLISGWLLGGPVHIGTVLNSLLIGHATGLTLPFFYRLTDKIMKKVTDTGTKRNRNVKKRCKTDENFNKGRYGLTIMIELARKYGEGPVPLSPRKRTIYRNII